MHTYHVRTGRWEHPEVGLVGVFYSGNGEGKNNPDLDHVHDVGPIPIGKYAIGAPEDRPGHTGAYSMALTPLLGTDTHGRSGFYCHGDKIGAPPGTTSLGCIVGPRLARWAIGGSADHLLEVVAD